MSKLLLLCSNDGLKCTKFVHRRYSTKIRSCDFVSEKRQIFERNFTNHGKVTATSDWCSYKSQTGVHIIYQRYVSALPNSNESLKANDNNEQRLSLHNNQHQSEPPTPSRTFSARNDPNSDQTIAQDTGSFAAVKQEHQQPSVQALPVQDSGNRFTSERRGFSTDTKSANTNDVELWHASPYQSPVRADRKAKNNSFKSHPQQERQNSMLSRNDASTQTQQQTQLSPVPTKTQKEENIAEADAQFLASSKVDAYFSKIQGPTELLMSSSIPAPSSVQADSIAFATPRLHKFDKHSEIRRQAPNMSERSERSFASDQDYNHRKSSIQPPYTNQQQREPNQTQESNRFVQQNLTVQGETSESQGRHLFSQQLKQTLDTLSTNQLSINQLMSTPQSILPTFGGNETQPKRVLPFPAQGLTQQSNVTIVGQNSSTLFNSSNINEIFSNSNAPQHTSLQNSSDRQGSHQLKQQLFESKPTELDAISSTPQSNVTTVHINPTSMFHSSNINEILLSSKQTQPTSLQNFIDRQGSHQQKQYLVDSSPTGLDAKSTTPQSNGATVRINPPTLFNSSNANKIVSSSNRPQPTSLHNISDGKGSHQQKQPLAEPKPTELDGRLDSILRPLQPPTKTHSQVKLSESIGVRLNPPTLFNNSNVEEIVSRSNPIQPTSFQNVIDRKGSHQQKHQLFESSPTGLDAKSSTPLSNVVSVRINPPTLFNSSNIKEILLSSKTPQPTSLQIVIDRKGSHQQKHQLFESSPTELDANSSAQLSNVASSRINPSTLFKSSIVNEIVSSSKPPQPISLQNISDGKGSHQQIQQLFESDPTELEAKLDSILRPVRPQTQTHSQVNFSESIAVRLNPPSLVNTSNVEEILSKSKPPPPTSLQNFSGRKGNHQYKKQLAESKPTELDGKSSTPQSNVTTVRLNPTSLSNSSNINEITSRSNPHQPTSIQNFSGRKGSHQQKPQQVESKPTELDAKSTTPQSNVATGHINQTTLFHSSNIKEIFSNSNPPQHTSQQNSIDRQGSHQQKQHLVESKPAELRAKSSTPASNLTTVHINPTSLFNSSNVNKIVSRSNPILPTSIQNFSGRKGSHQQKPQQVESKPTELDAKSTTPQSNVATGHINQTTLFHSNNVKEILWSSKPSQATSLQNIVDRKGKHQLFESSPTGLDAKSSTPLSNIATVRINPSTLFKSSNVNEIVSSSKPPQPISLQNISDGKGSHQQKQRLFESNPTELDAKLDSILRPLPPPTQTNFQKKFSESSDTRESVADNLQGTVLEEKTLVNSPLSKFPAYGTTEIKHVDSPSHQTVSIADLLRSNSLSSLQNSIHNRSSRDVKLQQESSADSHNNLTEPPKNPLDEMRRQFGATPSQNPLLGSSQPKNLSSKFENSPLSQFVRQTQARYQEIVLQKQKESMARLNETSDVRSNRLSNDMNNFMNANKDGVPPVSLSALFQNRNKGLDERMKEKQERKETSEKISLWLQDVGQEQPFVRTKKTKQNLDKDEKLIVIPIYEMSLSEASQTFRMKADEMRSRLFRLGLLNDFASKDDEEVLIDADMMELLATELGREYKRLERDEIPDGNDILLQRRLMATDNNVSVQNAAVGSYQSFPPRPPVVCIMGHVDHGKTTLMDSLRTKAALPSSMKSDKKKKKKKTPNDKNASVDTVAGTEAGGITQAISAFQVKLSNADNETDINRSVTFLDTPGHAAFTAMRQSGTNAADVIVLVVAADDGVSAQTIEILNVYKTIVKESNGSIALVVAMNKIDKPGLNLDECQRKIENQLMEQGIFTEGTASSLGDGSSEFGPPAQLIRVSGLSGEGLDDLIDGLLIQSEVMDLRADTSCHAEGIVMDARVEKGLGIVADCIIRWGSVKKGDIVVSGIQTGKVRSLKDVDNKPIKQGLPSQPVRIIGFENVPSAGQPIIAVESEEVAYEIIEQRMFAAETAAFELSMVDADFNDNPELQSAGKHMMNESWSSKLETRHSLDHLDETETIRIPVILKTDTEASLVAARDALVKIGDQSKYNLLIDPVKIGIGPVLAAEISTAKEANALIFSFNVKNDSTVTSIAEEAKVPIISGDVIYRLLEEAKVKFSYYLPLQSTEMIHGRAKVQQVFKLRGKIENGSGTVAGLQVLEGDIIKSATKSKQTNSSTKTRFRIKRDGKYLLSLNENAEPNSPLHFSATSLKLFKTDVDEVSGKGKECGLSLGNFEDFQPDDIIECFSVEFKREFV